MNCRVKHCLICLFLIQTLDLIFLGMILFVVLLYPFCVAVKLMSIFGKEKVYRLSHKAVELPLVVLPICYILFPPFSIYFRNRSKEAANN